MVTFPSMFGAPSYNPLDDILMDVVPGVQSPSALPNLADPLVDPLMMDQRLAHSAGIDPVPDPSGGINDFLADAYLDPVDVSAAAGMDTLAPDAEEPLTPVAVPPVLSAQDAAQSLAANTNIRTATPEELAGLNKRKAAASTIATAMEAMYGPEVGAVALASANQALSDLNPVPVNVNGKIRQFVPELNAFLPESVTEPPKTIKAADGKNYLFNPQTQRYDIPATPGAKVPKDKDAPDSIEAADGKNYLWNPQTGRYDIPATPGVEASDSGPFGGTAMDAQAWNMVLNEDKKGTPEWFAAKAHLERPKFGVDPQTGQSYQMPGISVDSVLSGQGVAQTGQTGQGPTPKTGVEQGKAAGFARRLGESLKVMSSPTEDGSSVFQQGSDIWQRARSGVPIAGNYLVSEDFQRYDQAKRDMINAILRRESGAVIAESEFANAERQYFPQPGDSDAVIEQKLRNLETQMVSFIKDAGPNFQMDVPDLRGMFGLQPVSDGATPDNLNPGSNAADLTGLSDQDLSQRLDSATTAEEMDAIEAELTRRGF